MSGVLWVWGDFKWPPFGYFSFYPHVSSSSKSALTQPSLQWQRARKSQPVSQVIFKTVFEKFLWLTPESEWESPTEMSAKGLGRGRGEESEPFLQSAIVIVLGSYVLQQNMHTVCMLCCCQRAELLQSCTNLTGACRGKAAWPYGTMSHKHCTPVLRAHAVD